MQTFLPDACFRTSCSVLDRQRLGKQRVEAFQVLRTLTNETTGWRNHPCTRMWRGFEHRLIEYGLMACLEWQRRGYQDTIEPRFLRYKELYKHRSGDPPWLGCGEFHRSHRSNLLRKNRIWYSQFWPEERDDLPYVWPQPKEP